LTEEERARYVEAERTNREKVIAEEKEKRMKVAEDIEYDALHQTGFPEPTEAEVSRWINDVYNDINNDNAWGGMGWDLSGENVKKYQERARLRIVEDWRKKIRALRLPEANRFIVARINLRMPGKSAAKYEIDYWVDKFLKDTENDTILWAGNVIYDILAPSTTKIADGIIKIKVPDTEILRIEKPPLAKMPAAQAKMPAWA
jgi:hypothetical protein